MIEGHGFDRPAYVHQCPSEPGFLHGMAKQWPKMPPNGQNAHRRPMNKGC